MRKLSAGLSAILALTLAGAVAAPAFATQRPEVAKKKDKDADKADAAKAGDSNKPGDKKDESKEKPFAEVVKEFTLHEGLFNIYRKDDKTLLELRPDQYDVLFMASVTRLNGVGEGELLGNQMLDNYLIQFHKVGKGVQLVMKNVMFRADTDPAMKHAVDRGFADSLVASAALASQPHPDRKSDLVDLSPFFLRDVERVSQYTETLLK